MIELYASGKLLLFGEYLVLKGADCLAIPLNYGQSLRVEEGSDSMFTWKAKAKDQLWFNLKLSHDFQILETSDSEKAQKLIQIFKYLKNEKPHLFQSGLQFFTQTDFPLEWGFGSSSTLISLLSQWSGADPFSLLKHSFGGSGYDVACATQNTPVLFNIQTQKAISVQLHSNVTDYLLFVYSGKKQNSGIEVKNFGELDSSNVQIDAMNQIVSNVIQCDSIEDFEQEMDHSEELLSSILQIPNIKKKFFPDYLHSLKSLGAWGGDFFMATFRDEFEARNYFNNLGYSIQFNYHELIKENDRIDI